MKYLLFLISLSSCHYTKYGGHVVGHENVTAVVENDHYLLIVGDTILYEGPPLYTLDTLRISGIAWGYEKRELTGKVLIVIDQVFDNGKLVKK